MKTLEEIAARAFPEADHRASRCLVALREAVAQEHERLYQQVVLRISADIAGNFELALDQLEYNAAANAVAQEHKALREWADDALGDRSMTYYRGQLDSWLRLREKESA